MHFYTYLIHMSETFWVAIVAAAIGAVPPTLAALAAVRATKLVSVKADEIHTLTNSKMTAVKEELAEAKTEIINLQIALAASLEKKKGDSGQVAL
jgi:hypothetical protein